MLNEQKTNLKGFNYMGLDVPGHMKINPEQAQILNVRYQGGKPIKRSVIGDKDEFHAKKVKIETNRQLNN
jgi:hypothetical protein